MNIEVRQQKLAVGDRYEVFIDGDLKYYVISSLFKIFFSELQIFDLSENRVALIEQKFDWFKLKYKVNIYYLSAFEINTKRIFAMEYEAKISNDTYLITRHAGLKISVFKNGTQIARASKNYFTWFEGDIYNMEAENNADPLILISFIITIDNFFYNNKANKGIFDLKFGNLGIFSNKFDNDWKPKK